MTPVPSHVSTFIVWPRFPTNTNSARDLGSARIFSRTKPPSLSYPSRMSTGSSATIRVDGEFDAKLLREVVAALSETT